MNTRQVDENLRVSFFVDHIRTLNLSFDSKLADVENPSFSNSADTCADRRLTWVTWSPSQGVSRPDEVACRTAVKSIKSIVPLGTFRLPWLRFCHDFSSAVRQMPGNNAKTGTARFSPQARRLRQSAFPLSPAFCWDYGNLISNPR